MLKLIYIALAPIFIILLSIYIKDRYEKEPMYLAITGCFYGLIFAFPISFTEHFLSIFSPSRPFYYKLYTAFIVASLVEEAYKYIILRFLIWKNQNYNEPFDAMLYAVYISLGFASIENILYIFNKDMGGLLTAILRAIFSIPAHAIFGIYMGYYLSKSKYFKKSGLLSFIMPFFIHGMYDFILFSDIPYHALFFIIFYLYIIIISLKRINFYIKISPFKNKK